MAGHAYTRGCDLSPISASPLRMSDASVDMPGCRCETVCIPGTNRKVFFVLEECYGHMYIEACAIGMRTGVALGHVAGKSLPRRSKGTHTAYFRALGMPSPIDKQRRCQDRGVANASRILARLEGKEGKASGRLGAMAIEFVLELDIQQPRLVGAHIVPQQQWFLSL